MTYLETYRPEFVLGLLALCALILIVEEEATP